MIGGEKRGFAGRAGARHGPGMSDRELALETVRRMPDECSLESIIEELRLLAEVRQGLAESERDEGITAEAAKACVRAWTSE